MYDAHNPLIAAAMRECPDTFARGILFAVCSMRQAIVNVPDQLEQIDQGDMEPLFGFKLNAWQYAFDHRAELHSAVLAAPDNATRIDVLCRVPGLGIVKAAFVLQLMGFDVGCLDSRNVKREGRNPRAFRTDGKKTGPAFHRKIARYLAETEGKSRYYWDTWCCDVAERYGKTPVEISALHLAIVPDNYIPF